MNYLSDGNCSISKTLLKTAFVPLLSDVKTGFLAEARKEPRRVPLFIASSIVLKQMVLILINIPNSSLANY